MLEIFGIRANEHVTHEESMVSASAYDSDLDAVFLVPSCKTVDDVNTISCVEVVDGSFTIDSPNLFKNTD